MKNTYMKDFYSGYKTWQLNKFVGDGIRSYRQNCSKTEVVNCGPHPHNYYLDVMVSTGVLGLIILIVSVIWLLFKASFLSFKILPSNA